MRPRAAARAPETRPAPLPYRPVPHMTTPYSAQRAPLAAIRRIAEADLPQIARFAFTVSITEAMTSLDRLREVFARTGLWTDEAGAVAIVEAATGRLVGTAQFYRSGPCIHGLELGYIIHDTADRGRGFATPAVRQFSDLVHAERPAVWRQQLLIETWNTPSWKLAERCGFLREGVLRSCGFGEGDPADCLVYSRTRKDYEQQLVSHQGVAEPV